MPSYVAILRKEPRSDYGVDFPDFLGCITVGETRVEAERVAHEALRLHIQSVREKLGPIDVVQWTAYASGAGDWLAVDAAEVRTPLDIAVTSLLATVQAALPDLRANKGAVLVTNGGLGFLDPQIDTVAVQWKASGLAIANAAKHKLVRLLSKQLEADGVYVGEVSVLTAVKGTAWDDGSSKLEASAIAAKFWQIYTERRELSVPIG